MQLPNLLIIITSVWLTLLTVLALRAYYLVAQLNKNSNKGDFTKVLDKLLDQGKKNSSEIELLKKALALLSSDSKTHIQKVGLVKFNPFGEMGGNQSFALALLDANNSGIVITGLHARDKTRLYLKNITKGKSEIELSSEEKRSLSQAMEADK